MLTDILPCFFSLLILIYHHDLWAKIVIIYEVCVFVYLFFRMWGSCIGKVIVRRSESFWLESFSLCYNYAMLGNFLSK